MGAHIRNTKRGATNHHRAQGKKLANRFSPTAVFTTWDTTTESASQPTQPASLTDTAVSSPSTTTPTATPSSTPNPPLAQSPSTSSTSTSTPPPSTPSSLPVQSPTTTPLATAAPVTSSSVQLTTPTTLLASPSTANSVASSTSSPRASSATNVGGIVGGIAGGLIGLVVIIFIIRFIMRRQALKEEKGVVSFNASDFRRSAVLMNDPPTHDDTVAWGYNPRPPTMIERRFASPAPTFGTQYSVPGPQHYGDNAPGHEYGTPDPYGQYAFGPGQVMNNASPHSATPMYQNANYAQSPFSPVSSPISSTGPGQYEQGYNGRDVPPTLTRQSSAGTLPLRPGSAGAQENQSYNLALGLGQEVNYPAPVVIASRPSGTPYPKPEYVTLDRTSVTPFQAAQYAEISKKLNTDVPTGVDDKAEYNVPAGPAGRGPSPFADPIPTSLIPARVVHDSLTVYDTDRPGSADSRSSVSVVHDLNFPAPPSPALTIASRFRVDSTPPTLPEISVESRNSPLRTEFPSDVASVNPGPRLPATSSPLAANAPVSSPSMEGNPMTTVPSTVAPGNAVSAKDPKRPQTLYDPEDVYGGI